MSGNTDQDPKPDGKAFDDFFESLGKKAEHLTSSDQNGVAPPPATTSSETTSTTQPPVAEEDQKIVEEIESLCMNCREDVRIPKKPCLFPYLTLRSRELHASS